jgi:short chain dehydrogenase
MTAPLSGQAFTGVLSDYVNSNSCVTTVVSANQVALITGADSGIGRAVALAFAREGADIAIAYLNEHADAEVHTTHMSALLLLQHATLVTALGGRSDTVQPEHHRRQGALWRRQAAKRCCCPATCLRKPHARLMLQRVTDRQGFDACTRARRQLRSDCRMACAGSCAKHSGPLWPHRCACQQCRVAGVTSVTFLNLKTRCCHARCLSTECCHARLLFTECCHTLPSSADCCRARSSATSGRWTGSAWSTPTGLTSLRPLRSLRCTPQLYCF